MNAKQIEVHDFYKAQHPEALIVYRMPETYMVLGNDVERASKSVSSINILDDGVGILPNNISVISELGSNGIEVVIVSYKNDFGEFDLPDVKRLEAEKEMDY